MAKGNLFLGQAKGKVGSIVFSRAFGKQITRTKATSVKNPKTIGQNTQRAILATIAKSAAALTSLVDHSFAGVTYGAESVRYFRKVNMGIIRNLYLNKPAFVNLVAKGGNFVPNPLKISGGSLPPFYAGVDTEDSTMAFYQSETVLQRGEDISVFDFLAAYPNIQGGDQITLVKIKKVTGSLKSGNGIFTMSLDRMVFSPNAFDDLDAVIIEKNVGKIKDSFLDLTKTTNKSMLQLTDGGPGVGLGFADNECYYAALILSRKVNNQWQRSTQSLEMMNYDDSADNAAAVDSYGETSSLSEETEYLNQAEEGDEVSGVSGSYMSVDIYPDGGDAISKSVKAGGLDTINLAAASNTDFKISGQGYGSGDSRVTQVEIYNNDGELVAHGYQRAWKLSSVQSDTVGTWKIVTLFWDGRKATCNIVVAVQG